MVTADNVTLDLDCVLYTRVEDGYKARYVIASALEEGGLGVGNCLRNV